MTRNRDAYERDDGVVYRNNGDDEKGRAITIEFEFIAAGCSIIRC